MGRGVRVAAMPTFQLMDSSTLNSMWRTGKRTAFFSLILLAPILLIPCALRAENRTLVASGTITVSREKGRPVFSNDGAPKADTVKAGTVKAGTVKIVVTPATAGTTFTPPVATGRDVNEALTPAVPLMYWSNTEHRYKPVPHATPMAMKAAKSAVADVDRYVGSETQSGSNMQLAGNSLVRSSATPREVDDAIELAARRHNVDANLVRALIHVESNFNSKAVSRKGAMGLMQLMPSTARQLKVTNPFDPDQNVDAGVRHLKQLLQDFNGNVKLSLAAYNAGAGAVHRNAGIPNYAETRNYVSRITSLYNSGDNSPFHALGAGGPRYEPMKVFRDSQGVLTFTNTD